MIGNFLSPSLGTRGVCEDLAERLRLSGWMVITASHKPGRSARLVHMLKTTWSHRHTYAVAQIDVYSGPAFIWAEAVCTTLQRLGKPYILTLHGGNLPEFALRCKERMYYLLSRAAVVTTPSLYLREAMQAYRSDIHLLPNPINLSLYTYSNRNHPAPYLIWLRAFHQIYNPSMAPRVLAKLIPNFSESKLTMIGPDKGDNSLQLTMRVADELGIRGRLSLPGSVAKAAVPACLGQGDIFLNTTNVDNTPVSVIEAMACGLCVVSTNVGGIPYLLDDGNDALLVPPEDPEAMAVAVRRILIEPGLAARLSHNARKKAEQYDWSAVLPQWEELLQRVASGR